MFLILVLKMRKVKYNLNLQEILRMHFKSFWANKKFINIFTLIGNMLMKHFKKNLVNYRLMKCQKELSPSLKI